MFVSVSTNGFLLSADVVRDLEVAGLDELQVSVDRRTPTASTHKALKILRAKLTHLRNSKIRTQVPAFCSTKPWMSVKKCSMRPWEWVSVYTSVWSVRIPDRLSEYLSANVAVCRRFCMR